MHKNDLLKSHTIPNCFTINYKVQLYWLEIYNIHILIHLKSIPSISIAHRHSLKKAKNDISNVDILKFCKKLNNNLLILTHNVGQSIK